MKKILLLLLLPFLFCGCYYTELNDLSIIDSIGIDYQEESYVVTLSIVDTLEYKSEDNMQTNIYTASGKTVEEAMHNFYLEMNKTIYLDSLNNLLLSDHLSDKNIKEIVDFFIKDNSSRNTFNMIYVKNSTMKDILSSPINLKSLLITNNKEFGNSSLYSFEDFYKDNLNYSFVPTIYYKDKVIVDNYSVFKDYKCIGYLNEEEAIVYTVMNNKVKNIHLHIEDAYIKVTDIHSTIVNNEKTEITIRSIINKNKWNMYDHYLEKNIHSLLKKYKLYDDYHLKIKTKYIKE